MNELFYTLTSSFSAYVVRVSLEVTKNVQSSATVVRVKLHWLIIPGKIKTSILMLYSLRYTECSLDKILLALELRQSDTLLRYVRQVPKVHMVVMVL